MSKKLIDYYWNKLQRSKAKKNKPPPRGKVGRNEKCPCGSGLKYKFCHGRR